ncbi:hypothetical protein SAMD00079811_19710 [Scytonema sp. HK-05]|uniref:hypothetical protein n=1 Tax=Scytonema sp. HK-05 TaxID=1137095 RepID=UPI00093632CA|nr:hypothetical protein [Scytonema sp. HK-05]OKH57691.1 hypothetical protein NIES2130_18405 [Scytonema sp. HK-05]BAY44373.1 hypothetical protein SAMD00079811_19710 [Scytonema sp. HK-05]
MTAGNQNSIKENRDYLIKQSEMLQAIINRMASNSLAVKQLALSIWTALMGFGFTNKNPPLFLLAIISFYNSRLTGYVLPLPRKAISG